MPPDLREYKVLVVEDDSLTRVSLLTLFRTVGVSAVGAASVAEATAALRDEPVDAVFLDLMLPDGEGSALLARIRADGLAVRVAVTTGAGDQSLVARAMPHRPDRVFYKPVEFDDLHRWLVSGRDGGCS